MLKTFFIFITLSFFGMVRDLDAQLSSIENKIFDVYTTPRGSKWITFNGGSNIEPELLFKNYKDYFHLSNNSEMVLYRSTPDELGYTHLRFQQYCKGVIVEYQEFILHVKNGYVERANGSIAENLDLNTIPSITTEEAINIAKREMGAKQYWWENPKYEYLWKKIKKDKNATSFPSPTLIVTNMSEEDENLNIQNFILCYKLDLRAVKPNESYSFYIDAHTGKVVKKQSLSFYCNDGSVTTLYNGVQTIKTLHNDNPESDEPHEYYLEDTCENSNEDHSDINTHFDYENTDYFETYDSDNNWDDSINSRAAATAHWATVKTYNYYKNTFNRISYNDLNSQMWTNVDPTFQNNASWNGAIVQLGKKTSNNKYYVSLDVVGHEWTHAVIQTSAKLRYQKEPGALNESFSDIFGTMVEFYGQGDDGDWTCAEDIGTLRSLENPKLYNQPNTYHGKYWFKITNCTPTNQNDSCGVHKNSGVQNYWFYLLSVGGTGHVDDNPNKPEYNVTGIGKEKAANIAYKNLTEYLSSNSDYFDAERGSIWAARDLYGLGSQELLQTCKAWFAVGVVLHNDYTLNNNTTLNIKMAYIAYNSISAGPFSISNSGGAIMYAGNKIKLKTGFRSLYGSEFRATTSFSQQPFGISGIASVASQNYSNTKQQIKPQKKDIPTEFSLSENFPNPFNPVTTINYGLKENVNVELKIYNLIGEEIITLINEYQEAGYKTVTWDGKDNTGYNVSSGLYIYRIVAGNFSQSNKMILLK
ncbi:MAG: M4 family metallopeptidase [Bacteroidota bacterium]